ncbi:hypothetical protein CLAFUW4_13469 [Fulvia fulva]|uniref:Uncharacterized protein n=1 Tax=Passalora fulva TaxID=5499 RepID=A0A9Q8UV24_PASFU|nr:uncharacterized protein CLAFUR5_13322 [Fulvia fulva]KAK4612245.1 hypothetical protein CLAFUR4_13472 [Fulvia fulva]KAK4612416.1 hypothetical protein CLAFUR0_13480 [Fulvia fulva]UJO23397.1 hypothetical protein CLAFUR5_13322 [Fulvia fulva]WPV20815.1 hypothetical protein CLAFUW4_13469 [Fulvia fulva]WPV36207.1 hypothetical protein CLAFUW7_13476 [Fulvia fulva]
MHTATIDLIKLEGAHVIVSQGNYDQAVDETWKLANLDGGLLIQDFAFGDYKEIPQWIVEGYQTMMQEIDEQV